MPRPLPDLTGRTFGRLTVISRVPGPGMTYWNCLCSCGSETQVRHGNLRSGNTRSCGCLNQERLLQKQRGEANPSWKGDDIQYGSMHTRLRDNRGRAGDNQCVDCDGPAIDWSYVGGCPGERYQAVNGYEVAYCPHLDCYVPRCKRCHKNYDNQMRKEVA